VSVPRLASRKRQGARDAAWSSGHLRKRAKGNGMNFVSDRVDGLVNLLGNYDALNIYKLLQLLWFVSIYYGDCSGRCNAISLFLRSGLCKVLMLRRTDVKFLFNNPLSPCARVKLWSGNNLNLPASSVDFFLMHSSLRTLRLLRSIPLTEFKFPAFSKWLIVVSLVAFRLPNSGVC
jgi:hypothetical protein